MNPVEALNRIGELLERMREPTYRVRAFRGAADAIKDIPEDELRAIAARGGLRAIKGVGEKTERVILQALAGEDVTYLTRLLGDLPDVDSGPGAELRVLLKGDCHVHSDWSDGGSSIEDMARTAMAIGHEYIVLTDHSPRLTVANGLSPDRLRRQLDVVAELNETLAPFRILTGIEVDILLDGDIDQEEDLLARLDVVVASVHSKLRQDEAGMTARMLRAIENPHVDILGHCTGRMVVGRGRPESTFDAAAVFAAAVEHDVAIEINCRPERLDPPKRLLRQAVAAGCRFAIDTDAHAPGQLEWQPYGCDRAVECEVPADRVVNTLGTDDLLAWVGSRRN